MSLVESNFACAVSVMERASATKASSAEAAIPPAPRPLQELRLQVLRLATQLRRHRLAVAGLRIVLRHVRVTPGVVDFLLPEGDVRHRGTPVVDQDDRIPFLDDPVLVDVDDHHTNTGFGNNMGRETRLPVTLALTVTPRRLQAATLLRKIWSVCTEDLLALCLALLSGSAGKRRHPQHLAPGVRTRSRPQARASTATPCSCRPRRTGASRSQRSPVSLQTTKISPSGVATVTSWKLPR